MKYFCLCLITCFLFGCSDSNKEQVINVLPLGGVPDDDFEGEYTDGSFDIRHNPHTGSIVGYKWDDPKLGIAFVEPDNYPYGFDRSTKADVSPEQDRFVYISTKNGENAYFKPVFYPLPSGETPYDSYKLVNDATGYEYLLEANIYQYIPEGDYSLKGFNKIEWIDLDKHIKVLSYAPKEKQFNYIQLDGDGWDTDKDVSSFTKTRIIDAFNEVYSQVVMTPIVNEQDPSVYNKPSVNLDLSQLLQINMVEPNSLIPEHVRGIAQERLLKQLNGKDLEKLDASTITDRHFVFAINKAMKYWPLESLYGVTDDLAELMKFRFDPAGEPEGTTYAIQSVGECEDGVGAQGVGVTIRRVVLGDGKYHYYAYHNGTRVSFGACDYLYTTNGFPVIPYANPRAAAVSYPLGKGYFNLGSVVWAPRKLGKSAFYTVMHELGHSFGLTDVAMGDAGYYASFETGVMTWRQPTGRKIRYRGQQVVYTSGGGSPDECAVDGVYENQWACLRDECDFYDHWRASNPIRKYWDDKDVEKCLEGI